MWTVDVPKTDDIYFERMSKAIFQAGLNWKMIQNKWPNFRKAFFEFSIAKVAKFDEANVKSLMQNSGIIRNEEKIRATIFNAKEFMRIKSEFGSFQLYTKSFHGANEGLSADVQDRFRHIGPSSARTFLWMTGTKLTPNAQEKIWIERHRKKEMQKED